MLQNLNNFSSLVLRLMLIAVIVMAVLYFGVSIWGNIALGRSNDTSLPDMPSLSKAPYQITMVTTGQTLLAREYETIDTGVYVLKGYYSLVDKKWQWHETMLELDTYYWGDIIIKRRE